MGAVPAEKASETSLDWNTDCANVLPHDYMYCRYGDGLSRVDDTCCRISYFQTVRFSSMIILKLNITVICGYPGIRKLFFANIKQVPEEAVL